MIKSFYSYFRMKGNIDDAAKRISELLQIEFAGHESSYLGVYWQYRGGLADKLTIEADLNDPKNPSAVITLSNFLGKNRDKESRHFEVHNRLLELEGIELTKELILETDQ